MSSASAGGFLTTEPPGKSQDTFIRRTDRRIASIASRETIGAVAHGAPISAHFALEGHPDQCLGASLDS